VSAKSSSSGGGSGNSSTGGGGAIGVLELAFLGVLWAVRRGSGVLVPAGRRRAAVCQSLPGSQPLLNSGRRSGLNRPCCSPYSLIDFVAWLRLGHVRIAPYREMTPTR
jgi:hypothetical protein